MFRTMNCADCPAQEAAVLVMKDERMIIIEFLIHFLKLVKQRWTIHNCYVSLKYKYGEDKYSTSPLTSNFPFGRLWGSAKIILKFLIKQRTKFSIKYLKFYGDLTERWRGKPNLDKQVWTINNYTGGTCSQREKLQRWAQPGSQSAPVWSKQVYIVTNQEDTEKELKIFPSKGNWLTAGWLIVSRSIYTTFA